MFGQKLHVVVSNLIDVVSNVVPGADTIISVGIVIGCFI